MSINPLNPRTHTVTLFQGDDLAHLQSLADTVNAAQRDYDDAREDAKDAPPAGMLDEDPVADAKSALDEAKEAHDAYLADAEPRAIKVVMRALGRKTWRDLVNGHPPREGNEGDKVIGVNDETFGDALVPACIASPVFTTTDERDAFLDSLTMAQFRSLYVTAFTLNTVEGATPKALTGSAPSLTGSATQP